MRTFIGKSQYDDKESFHLDYRPFNSGLLHSMRDEIRKINDRLYIGMGSMAASGGTLNPMPFTLYGGKNPWGGGRIRKNSGVSLTCHARPHPTATRAAAD